MAQGRLPMRKVKKVLEFHFDEGRSARAIASHCGLARRSVAQTLERFAASGLSWPEARDMEEEALDAALYRRLRASDGAEVDWAKVEKDLSGRGVTLMLLWTGMARDTSRRHELSDLVPPLPGMAAAPGRDDAPEPPSRRAAVRRLRRHDDPDHDRRDRARGAGVRGLDGRLRAALRRGDADPEDRRLVRLARALLRGHGLRARGRGARQHQAGSDQAIALRADPQRDLRRSARTL